MGILDDHFEWKMVKSVESEKFGAFQGAARARRLPGVGGAARAVRHAAHVRGARRGARYTVGTRKLESVVDGRRWCAGFCYFLKRKFAAPDADAYSAHQNTAMRALLTYYWLLLEVNYESEVDFVVDLRCLPSVRLP